MIHNAEILFQRMNSWGYPVLILVLGAVEFICGLYEKRWNKNERTLDIASYLFPLLIMGPVIAWFGLKFLPLAIPGLHNIFTWVPFIWGFMIIAVADDLTQYWYHRLHHEIPWLWRFHRTHHSASYMGMAMANRQNIIYTFFFSQIYLTVVLIYLGLGYPALFVRGIKSMIVTFAHSSIKWDKPFYRYRILHPVAWVLERLISTPATHHAHHAASTDDGIGYYKGNFGNMFFLWDIIFGTAHISRDYPAAYGISHYQGDEWYAQLLWPVFKSTITGSELSKGGPVVRAEALASTATVASSPAAVIDGMPASTSAGSVFSAGFPITVLIFALSLVSSPGSSFTASGQNIIQQQQPFKGVIGQTLETSHEYWTDPVKAPSGAPNVIWILLDDVGFGASATFGGLIATPVFDSLASQGIRYTNFHTAAICAPTRAALLTGRNHHYVHMGGFAHTILSAGFPGYDGRIPSDKGTVAEILRENGYNTFGVGKYGLTPDEDATDAGPFDRWPSGKGFDHYFGFLGSQTDQYKPDLIEDNAHVQPDGRHLSEQITDKALSYLVRQQKTAPGKPFFLYYAPGATHAPHQVDTSWSNLYKGKFDEGWDRYREKVFKRQQQLGIVPGTAVLPDRNPNIRAWITLSAGEKKLYARFMEIYAGYLTYTDHETGRLIRYLKQTRQLDNTLILLVIGDNGASKEGSQDGDIDRPLFSALPGVQDNLAHNLSLIGEIGTPRAVQGNYPLGWAQAMNTPFRYWKQDANAEGGTRNPLVVFYPRGIKEKGAIRRQYSHVIDLLPTTLEILGISPPEYIRGIRQDSLQGTSLLYTVAHPEAVSRHTTQYYYIFGARSVYHNGWKAELGFEPANNAFTGFSTPRIPKWELYNLNTDFTERIDLALKYPAKLAELRQLFDNEATRNHVYPLIDWDDVLARKIHKKNLSTTP